jgi:hypothetical protein
MFYLNNFFLGEAFKYDKGENFSGYVEKNSEPLCAEFCNSMKFHTFVNYLTWQIMQG